jgi:hypothetical protein
VFTSCEFIFVELSIIVYIQTAKYKNYVVFTSYEFILDELSFIFYILTAKYENNVVFTSYEFIFVQLSIIIKGTVQRKLRGVKSGINQ